MKSVMHQVAILIVTTLSGQEPVVPSPTTAPIVVQSPAAPTNNADLLVIGVTTKDEAIKMFGPPRSTMDASNVSVVSWSAFSGGKFNVTTLTFGLDGILRAKNVMGDLPPLLTAPPSVQASSPDTIPIGPKIKDFWVNGVEPNDHPFFRTITPATIAEAHKSCKEYEKTRELVFLDSKNWPGEAGRGFMTQLLTGVSVKKAEVRFYFQTPWMAALDALILAEKSYEPVDEAQVSNDRAGSNVFKVFVDPSGGNEKFVNGIVGKAQITTESNPIKNLVIELPDKSIVRPVGRRGNTFEFSLYAIAPNTNEFTLICIASDGLSLRLPVTRRDLISKGII